MQLLRIIIIMLQNITTGIRLIRSLTLPSFSLSLSLSLSLFISVIHYGDSRASSLSSLSSYIDVSLTNINTSVSKGTPFCSRSLPPFTKSYDIVIVTTARSQLE